MAAKFEEKLTHLCTRESQFKIEKQMGGLVAKI